MTKNNKFLFKRDRNKATTLSKKEILDNLRLFAEVSGKSSFTTREYDAWSKKGVRSDTITKIFGAWSKAMAEAGLKPTRVWKKDIKVMVDTYKQCWIDLGNEPTGPQLSSYLKRVNSPYKLSSYRLYFGKLSRLAERIEDHQAGKISDRELYERHCPPQKQRTVPQKLRYSILKRDGFRCVLCGASQQLNSSTKLEVDHIIPVSKGGDNSPSNLRTLCWDCNIGKSDEDP